MYQGKRWWDRKERILNENLLDACPFLWDPTNERSNGRIFVDLCQRVNGPRDHRTYHVVEIFFSWAFGYDHYENSRRIWYPDLWNLQHYRYQLTPEDFFADRYAFIWARWLRFRSTAERLKVMLKTGHPVW
jgi:hypothetical protein